MNDEFHKDFRMRQRHTNAATSFTLEKKQHTHTQTLKMCGQKAKIEAKYDE